MPPDAERLVRELFGEAEPIISQYVDILISKGIHRGLLGPREANRIWDRHILNSAAVADLIGAGSSVVDVGSGAGLPGIPLAILRPDLRMTLLEPLLRRSSFLLEAISDLGLAERVSVVRARAEDHFVRYDVVVARAVAPLDRLIGWCNPLRESGGILLALKGRNAAVERERAQPVLRQQRLNAEVLTISLDQGVEPVSVIRVTGA
jgi:16S rRNA (guanine527-N7)-methyltransferase